MLKTLGILCLGLMLIVPAVAQDAKKDAKKDAKEMKSAEMKSAEMKSAEMKSAEMKGYIVDAMCASGMAKKDDPMKAASMHTKGCALEEGCAESGFGVFSNGTYYKFDDAGDKMAMELIQKSETKKGMMVAVKGMMKDDAFAVSEIREYHQE